jgi:hypothetical protein
VRHGDRRGCWVSYGLVPPDGRVGYLHAGWRGARSTRFGAEKGSPQGHAQSGKARMYRNCDPRCTDIATHVPCPCCIAQRPRDAKNLVRPGNGPHSLDIRVIICCATAGLRSSTAHSPSLPTTTRSLWATSLLHLLPLPPAGLE